jgi:TPR repeat protein
MRACLSRLATICFAGAFLAGCADADDPVQTKATFDTGVAAYDAGHFEEAFAIFSSIDDVDLAAMRNVALMLRKGQGVEKNPAAAEAMYQRAAEAGLPTAAADLGEMLLKGEAGPPDPKAAQPWLALAADAHHPIAEFELGELYEDGTAVPKDLAKARALYAEAARLGVADAAKRLAAMPPELKPAAP